MFVTKGSYVRARYMRANPPGTASLTGMMPKTTADEVTVAGRVTHVWGDHPTDPTPASITVAIQPDDGGPEVEVPSSSIIGYIATR